MPPLNLEPGGFMFNTSYGVISKTQRNGFELSRPALYLACLPGFPNQDHRFQIALPEGSAAANG